MKILAKKTGEKNTSLKKKDDTLIEARFDEGNRISVINNRPQNIVAMFSAAVNGKSTHGAWATPQPELVWQARLIFHKKGKFLPIQATS